MDDNRVFYSGRCFRVEETNYLTKKVQRKTHRKKRINKKWLKRYGMHDVPDDGCILVMGDVLFMTPRTAQRIKKELGGVE
jgi:hypothetical protein